MHHLISTAEVALSLSDEVEVEVDQRHASIPNSSHHTLNCAISHRE